MNMGLTRSDYDLLTTDLTRLHHYIWSNQSETFGGECHIRLSWNDPEQFRCAYRKILEFCYDNDGVIVATSVKNMAVTLLIREENNNGV